MVDLTGVRLAKASLDQVLKTLGLAGTFPEKGLVLGMVLDNNGNPLSGVVVTSTAGLVEYLSADRRNILTGATSSSGIFVSRDAPFGSTFSAHGSVVQMVPSGYGGLVDGKVTIVVLQFQQPQGN
jgi:hypothetical protein